MLSGGVITAVALSASKKFESYGKDSGVYVERVQLDRVVNMQGLFCYGWQDSQDRNLPSSGHWLCKNRYLGATSFLQCQTRLNSPSR
jgi:hypothetical protein